MSLFAFQQAWFRLLSEPDLQADWASGEIAERELSASEQSSLQAICQSSLNWSQRLQRHLEQSLQDALPLRVRLLLADQNEPFARYFLQSKAPPPLFPKAHLQRQLLFGLLSYLDQAQLIIPHLRDLIAYELALSQLRYFGLPQALPQTESPGPILAPWVQVVLLGSQFPVVLAQLKNRQRPELSESKAQTFLLIQSFESLHLEAIDALLGECLLACHGSLSWSAIVEGCLARHAELDLGAERRALLPWEPHYLKRGILSRS